MQQIRKDIPSSRGRPRWTLAVCVANSCSQVANHTRWLVPSTDWKYSHGVNSRNRRLLNCSINGRVVRMLRVKISRASTSMVIAAILAKTNTQSSSPEKKPLSRSPSYRRDGTYTRRHPRRALRMDRAAARAMRHLQPAAQQSDASFKGHTDAVQGILPHEARRSGRALSHTIYACHEGRRAWTSRKASGLRRLGA